MIAPALHPDLGQRAAPNLNFSRGLVFVCGLSKLFERFEEPTSAASHKIMLPADAPLCQKSKGVAEEDGLRRLSVVREGVCVAWVWIRRRCASPSPGEAADSSSLWESSGATGYKIPHCRAA
jgi:hypothetical protein